jgi:hypothetical protein
MSIGLGIAFGALALRAASAINGNAGDHAQAFTLNDFRFAFLCAGVLVLVSIYGYVRLDRDAGHTVSGAALTRP